METLGKFFVIYLLLSLTLADDQSSHNQRKQAKLPSFLRPESNKQNRFGWQRTVEWLKDRLASAEEHDSNSKKHLDYFNSFKDDILPPYGSDDTDTSESENFNNDNIENDDDDDDDDENDYDYEKELQPSLVYGIQNVRDVKEVRRSKTNPHGKYSFQSLCPSRRETIHLNHDLEYEYRPDRYEEVTCLSPFKIDHMHLHNKVCGEAGFACIQLNRTIFLTKRRRDSTCWESETRIVLAGCECMWPKHTFGDISSHH